MPLPRLSFAVQLDPVPRKRQNMGNPLSPQWTLYNPEALAAKLGLPVDTVNEALRETGFAKAVSVRMEVLRWKERLRHEDQELHREYDRLMEEVKRVKARMSRVKEMLTNCRNILRLPRDPKDI